MSRTPPSAPARRPIMHLSPVNEPPPHAALEEAAAAVASVDAVMFAAAGVAAHPADQRRAQGLPRGRALGCGGRRGSWVRARPSASNGSENLIWLLDYDGKSRNGCSRLTVSCGFVHTEPLTAHSHRRFKANSFIILLD